ncbi:hypothetical protein GGQ73_000599 [Rhizobium skierniewicense]|uniref:Uncharacterized protein n=1 Tax=Rhizobium skierniewicense TaxID=984260 RepID=A0A7W6G0R7_9HYPH|nr:hypothetical protein [Rhizobium skierniewicense]MBB3944674.1 hypothetical protein [Rhizobium skierniewicense]
MTKAFSRIIEIEGTLVDPRSISSEVILAEYARRGLESRVRPTPTSEINEAYRLIAENRNSDAMDVLARAFQLAPPVPRTQDRGPAVLR